MNVLHKLIHWHMNQKEILQLENYTRSFVKGFIWELIGLVIIYILTQSVSTSLGYVSIRIVLYFVYDRIWKYIKWGHIQ